MQFSPKSRERYLSSLRIYLQNKIFKSGVTNETLRKIKKIVLAELKYSNYKSIPVNLKEYADRILGAGIIVCLSKGYYFSTDINSKSNYLLDTRIFNCILMEIIIIAAKEKNACISITGEENSVKILFKGKKPDKRLKFFLNKISGVFFRNENGNLNGIIIPAVTTSRESNIFLDEVDYICDRLSIINVYLSDLA